MLKNKDPSLYNEDLAPIPNNEMSRNPNWDQNPGYSR